MSKQKDIIPMVVERLTTENPGCGIILHGSVQHGYERPDSDIDLFVITQDGESMRFDLDRTFDGVRVQICYWPSRLLADAMRCETFLFYPLSHGCVLTDPLGLAKPHQAAGQSYFANNPKMANIWKRQMAEVRQIRIEGSYKDGKFLMSPQSKCTHMFWNEWADFLRKQMNLPE
jgi:hypothetical protein